MMTLEGASFIQGSRDSRLRGTFGHSRPNKNKIYTLFEVAFCDPKKSSDVVSAFSCSSRLRKNGMENQQSHPLDGGQAVSSGVGRGHDF